MKLIKQYKFWTCLLLALAMFAGTYPFAYAKYVSLTVYYSSLALNGFSAILFNVFIYKKWTDSLDVEFLDMFYRLTIIQFVAHVLVIFVNWGSFLFVIMSGIMLLLYLKEDKKWK